MQLCSHSLLEIFKKGGPEEKKQVIDALSEVNCNSSMEVLVKALLDRDPGVKRSAMKALDRMDQGKVKKTVQKHMPLLSETLMYDLKDTSWPVRSFAARILGKLGEKNALSPLLETLQDKEGYVRYFATEALGRLGDSSVISNLVEVIEDEKGDIRNYVVDTIKSLLEHFPDIPTPQELVMLEDSAGKLKKYDASCISEVLKIMEGVIRERKIQKSKDIVIIDTQEAGKGDLEIIELI